MKKKKWTPTRVFFHCLLIGIAISYVSNQIIINYYMHTYKGVDWFSRFYTPPEIYKIVKYFIENNARYTSKSLGFDLSVAEGIIYVTFWSGFIGGMLLALFVYRALVQKDLSSDRYGTAEFETKEAVMKSDKVDIPDEPSSFEKHGRWGLFIGSLQSNQGSPISWRNDDKTTQQIYLTELAHFGSQHVFVFAPTGSGKGVGIVMPILVTYPSSIFVLDIKGENYRSTAGYRNKIFDNVIIKYEPSCADGSSARYNPLDEIRVGTVYEMADAQKLALAIVDQDGKGLHDHWTRKAADLMTSVILHIIYTKENRNLNALSLFLSGVHPDSKEHYQNETAWLNEMIGKGWSGIHRNGYAKLKGITPDEAQQHLKNLGLVGDDGVHITIKAGAAPLAGSKAEGERSSIISSATGPLSLYKDPVVAMNTAVSDFRLNDLQNFNRPVSFYLVVPNDQRDRLKPLIRLLITQTINNIQSSQEGKIREITFLLDEFPELNKLEVMESALATIRGYKVRMVLITQDYLQLTKYYGENQTIFSNCGVRIAYAPNEMKTAEMLSKYTGVTTYVAQTTSTTTNKQPFQITVGSGSTTVNTSETSRNLLTADEITRLGDDMIILVEKKNPIRGHKFAWYLSDKFRERIFDPDNPKNPGNQNYKPPKSSHRIVRKSGVK